MPESRGLGDVYKRQPRYRILYLGTESRQTKLPAAGEARKASTPGVKRGAIDKINASMLPHRETEFRKTEFQAASEARKAIYCDQHQV